MKALAPPASRSADRLRPVCVRAGRERGRRSPRRAHALGCGRLRRIGLDPKAIAGAEQHRLGRSSVPVDQRNMAAAFRPEDDRGARDVEELDRRRGASREHDRVAGDRGFALPIVETNDGRSLHAIAPERPADHRARQDLYARSGEAGAAGGIDRLGRSFDNRRHRASRRSEGFGERGRLRAGAEYDERSAFERIVASQADDRPPSRP